MVGTGRFELPTPRTPSECSTRLSHVPTRLSRPRESRLWGLASVYTRRFHRMSPNARDMQRPLFGLVRGRDVLAGQRGSGAEEELLHLLDKELLRLGRPGLQTVLVQQHLLAFHPLVPRCFGDVLVDLLAKLGVEGWLVETLHLFLVANAKNH